jgi:hypothetical protein
MLVPATARNVTARPKEIRAAERPGAFETRRADCLPDSDLAQVARGGDPDSIDQND